MVVNCVGVDYKMMKQSDVKRTYSTQIICLESKCMIMFREYVLVCITLLIEYMCF